MSTRAGRQIKRISLSVHPKADGFVPEIAETGVLCFGWGKNLVLHAVEIPFLRAVCAPA